MSEIQNSLLEAIKAVSSSVVADKEATLTIECEILKIVDEGLGAYKVKYLDNTFIAYSGDSNKFYSEGDFCYVLIPNGDFNKDKYIIGFSSNSTSGPVVKINNKTQNGYVYNDIASFDFLKGDVITLPCTANQTKISLNLSKYLEGTKFKEFLKCYTIGENGYPKYNNFKIKCKIKTDIPFEYQLTGDYGLNFKYQNDNMEYINETFDTKMIEGNPYALSTWTDQEFTFSIDEDSFITDISDIYLFSQDFPTEDSGNVYFKNLYFVALDELEVKENSYNLSIVADSGTVFLPNDTYETKTLSPIFRVNGIQTGISNCECYWFVENPLINSSSDGFLSLAGAGWQCLNEKVYQNNNEGIQTYTYKTAYSQIINKTDIDNELRYRCIIIYNNQQVNGYITIINSQGICSIKLVADSNPLIKSFDAENDNYSIITCTAMIQNIDDLIEDNDDKSALRWSWKQFSKSGLDLNKDKTFEILYINKKIAPDTYESAIKVGSRSINEMNRFTCTVYREDNIDGVKSNHIYGFRSLDLIVKKECEYTLTINNGDTIFKYDSYGNSPLIAEYTGPISSRMAKGEIKPLTYNAYKLNGQEFTENEYACTQVEWKIPKNSLIVINEYDYEDDNYIYVYDEDSLYYSIATTYNFSKTENNITLTVELGNNRIVETKYLTFLKDGENGTNGTRYSAIVLFENDGEYFAKGQKDEDGFDRDLKMIYHPLSNEVQGYDEEEWIYLYGAPALETPSAYPYRALNPANNPHLKAAVYKDGVLLNSGYYDVEWGWYDENETHPCMTLKESNNEVDIIAAEQWDEEPRCNILQAKIRIGDKEALGNEQYIFAYYPIEIIHIERNNNLEILYGDYEYLEYIPLLTGGFDTVIYSSDSRDPNYDKTYPFKIDEYSDDVHSGIRSYYWESNDNLTLTNTENINERNGLPVSFWSDGNTQNYIKINSVPARSYTNLMDEIMKYDCEKQALDDIKGFFNITEKNNFKNLIEEIVEKISDRVTLTDNIQDLYDYLAPYLNYRYRLTEDLRKGIEHAGTLKELFDRYEVESYDYSSLIQYKDDLSAARTALLNNLTTSTIVNYELTDEEIANIKAEIGIGEYTILESKLKSLQEDTTDYINNSAMTSDIVNSKNYFITILTDIENIVEDFDDILTFETKTVQTTEIDVQYPSHTKTLTYTIKSRDILWNYRNLLDTFSSSIYTVSSIADFIRNCKDLIISFNPYIKVENNTYIIDENFIDSDYQNAIEGIILTYINNWGYTELINYTSRISDLKWNAWKSFFEYTIIKPILFMTNRYEMSNINAWDGSKIYTGENDEYILAPQLGAGIKNRDNSFTGMVMGIRNLGDGNKDVGLYGYSEGRNSFLLNALDGSATFGITGDGQIQIKPGEKAIIQSGNYNPELGTGMMIDFKTPEIKFGSEKFMVNSEGQITATDVDLTGKITATEGMIGGWTITETRIESVSAETESTFYLASNEDESEYYINITDYDGENKFNISKNGVLFAKDATIKGRIEADSGKIGAWTITAEGIQTESADSYMAITPTAIVAHNQKIGTGEYSYFQLNSNGNVFFNRLYIHDHTDTRTSPGVLNIEGGARINIDNDGAITTSDYGTIYQNGIFHGTFDGTATSANSANTANNAISAQNAANWTGKPSTIVTGVTVTYSTKTIETTDGEVAYGYNAHGDLKTLRQQTTTVTYTSV